MASCHPSPGGAGAAEAAGAAGAAELARALVASWEDGPPVDFKSSLVPGKVITKCCP